MNSHPRSIACRALLGAIGASTVLWATQAMAQVPYPSKPIKVVVGYAPGGSVDMAARTVADILAAKLNATVVVENVPGAAGVLAAQKVVSSPADGYTLLVGSSNEMAATSLVNPAQKYDPIKDLTPIGMVATAPVLLVASKKLPVNNLDEFIELVKRNPGKYSYGSSGVGSTLHFAGELVKQRAGLFLTHIPYRATAAISSDLIGGALDFGFMSPTAAAAFVQSGRITALGVTSATRLPSMPQVPALGEHPKLKNYDLSGWFALAAPRGLPPGIAGGLKEALDKGLGDELFRRRLEMGGATPASTKTDLTQVIKTDMSKYAELVKFANMREN